MRSILVQMSYRIKGFRLHSLQVFILSQGMIRWQQRTADSNKTTLFINMCDQYPVVFDILWALSFNHDIQQQLRASSSFMSKLARLAKESHDEQTRKAVHGISLESGDSHSGGSNDRYRWYHIIWCHDQLFAQRKRTLQTDLWRTDSQWLSCVDRLWSDAWQRDGRHGASDRTITDSHRLYEWTVSTK